MLFLGILLCITVFVATRYWHIQMNSHPDLWILATSIAGFGAVMVLLPEWIKAAAIGLPLAGVIAYCLTRCGHKRLAFGVAIVITILVIVRYGPAPVYTRVASHNGVTYLVTLRGEDTPVEGPSLTDISKTYPGWRFSFEGPANAKVRFPGQEKQLISSSWGVQGGTPIFFGPKGAKVKIVLTPP